MAGPQGGRRRRPGDRWRAPASAASAAPAASNTSAPASAVLVTAALALAIAFGGCQASSSGLAGRTPVAAPTSASPASTGPAAASTPSVAPPTSAAPTVPTTHVTSAPRSTTTTTPTTRPSTTTTVAAPPATTRTSVSGPLQVGSSGPPVLLLQQRLGALGYWSGAMDGNFGGTTQQAVYALQKAAGIPRTGIMDAVTVAALAAGTKASPKSTSGHVIEVDLTRQLVLIVTDGHLDAALNTSTGGGYVYYDQGSRQVAVTPTGHFTTEWEVDGMRVSSLGELWRPKFFVGGIAIHGDTYVPPTPVSHGCVRVSNNAIDWIWASGSDPIGTPVWVY